MKMHSRYNPNKVEAFDTGRETFTQQHLGHECNINTIMARATKSGVLASPGQRPIMPQYGDFSEIGSFQDAHNLVMKARDAFMEFPAIVRKRFDNDPGKMLAFLEDPSNKKEAVELGLIEDSPAQRAAEVAAPAQPTT